MQKVRIVGISLILLLLMACAPQAAQTPAPQVSAPAAAAAPAVAPAPKTALVPARAAWEAEWEKTMEAAKKEGKLVASTQLGPETRRIVTEAFRSRFGIAIDWLAGTSSELGVKILAERRAGIYSTDVGIIAFLTPYEVLKPAGALERLDRVLFLPELTDPQEIQKVWRFGLDWVDKDHTILAFAPSVSIPLTVNTQLVKPGEIKGYRDLLNPKWKGNIVLNDPTLGTGAAGTWGQAVGGHIMGWDYLRQLTEQEPFMTRDNRLGTEWVARGKYAVGIAFSIDIIKSFADLGTPIQTLLPEEGSYTQAGPNVIIFFKEAPHPNAAKLYINWLLSKEGQAIYCQAAGWPSSRMDVLAEGLNPLMIPDPKIRYFRTYSEEALGERQEALKMTRDILGKLRK